MRRSTGLTAPLLAAVATIAACSSDPAAPPLLYRVGESSYLLGTIHVGVAARDELPQLLWDRFDAAKRVGAEAEIRFIDSKEYETLAQLPAGSEGLEKLLAPATWSKLVALLGSGVSLSKLSRLRPWAVSSIVYHTLAPDPTIEGMDKTFLDAADAAQKPLFFLEVWQDQVNALNAEPLDDDLTSLAWLIDNAQQVKDKLGALIVAYKAGDVDEVWRLAPEAGAIAPPGAPGFETFITQRNRAWMPKLEAEISGGSAFVAVGFGHLYGEQGLLALLEQAGHAITRVE